MVWEYTGTLNTDGGSSDDEKVHGPGLTIQVVDDPPTTSPGPGVITIVS